MVKYENKLQLTPNWVKAPAVPVSSLQQRNFKTTFILVITT